MRRIAFALLLLIPTISLHAVEAPLATLEAPAPAEIQSRIDALTVVTPTEGDEETRALEIYRATLTALETLEKRRSRLREVQQLRANAPEMTQELQDDLAELPTEVMVTPPLDSTLEDLESLLAKARIAVQRLQEEVTALDAQLKAHTESRETLNQRLAELQDQRSQLSADLSQNLNLGERSEVDEANAALLTTRIVSVDVAIQRVTEEIANYANRRALLTAQKDLASRKANLASQRVNQLQDIVNERRREETEFAADQARIARLQAAQTHPVAAEIAETTENLATERTGQEGLSARLEAVTDHLGEVNRTLTRLREEYLGVQKRLDTAHFTSGLGIFLIRKLQGLPETTIFERSTRALHEEIAEVQLRLIELEDQRNELTDIPLQVAEAMERVSTQDPNIDDERLNDIREVISNLYHAQRDNIEALITDYNRYFVRLVDLESAERQLLELINDYEGFLRENIVWVQNTQPIHQLNFGKVFEGVIWILSPENWRDTAMAVSRNAINAPAKVLLFLLTILLTIWAGPRLRRVVQDRGKVALHGKEATMGHTIQALVASVLLTLLYPSIVYALGEVFLDPAAATQHSTAIGAALQSAGIMFLALEWFRQFNRPSGLADAHFSYSLPTTKLVRRTAVQAMTFLLPLNFFMVLSNRHSSDGVADSLGRLLFIAQVAVFIWITWRLLAPGSAVVKDIVRRFDFPLVERFRNVLHFLVTAILFGLILLTCLGYSYTSYEVSYLLALTMALMTVIVVGYSCAVRGFFLFKRNHALFVALHQHVESEPTGGDEQQEDEETSSLMELDINQIDKSYRRVINATIGLVLVFGTLFIWQDMVPALGVLDRVTLWSIVSETSEQVVDASGAVTSTVVERLVPVTLADLGMALLIILFAWLAVTNLPDLLETLVLRYLPVDPGARYAIKALTLYVVVVLGATLSLGSLGVRWSNIQWLVAAISVGLGFGLQEIFANFVSGLIIFFERPIRVGDLITIDNIDGQVTRIQARATTITGWDRKELVVPNKTFISGNLINWTLSDSILRLEFGVGVAYGSDIAKVEEVLKAIPAKIKYVLERPKPQIVFMGFGDSTLDWTFRVYIDNMDMILKVRHQVNCTIDADFRAADIEIAFPQRDLHIRSVQDVFRVRENTAEGAALPKASTPPIEATEPDSDED